jgi:hypothetical protein
LVNVSHHLMFVRYLPVINNHSGGSDTSCASRW